MLTPEATSHPDGAARALPGLAVPLAVDEILDRLGTASRRGRLPGFVPAPPGGALFRVAAFGNPVDGNLDARPRPVDGGTHLDFTLGIPRRLSVVLAAALAVTVWPGVYFMDQMMIQFLPGVRGWLPTWWWYLPVSILPIPWIWRSIMARARSTALQSAREMMDTLAGELGADIV